MKRNWTARMGRMGSSLVIGALVMGAAAEAFAADPPPSRKMLRQVEVLEKILDQVLLDSPYFLIRSTPVARGTYLEGHGVLLTFDASLVGNDWDGDFKWDFGGFKVETRDGKRVIILPDDEYDDDPDREEFHGDEDDEDLEGWRDRRRLKRERTYMRGKTEMVDLLLDYGDTMSTLKDNEHLTIMAFMTDEDFIDRNRVSRLILKAKMSDLRAYSGGDITEEEMVTRIREEEY